MDKKSGNLKRILFCHEKGGYPSILSDMGGPWVHCTKWD